jgi:hypothetical protein
MRYEPTVAYGRDQLATVANRLAAAGEDAPLLTGRPTQPPFLFWDLETTGLSGGAGTYAFLIGCGWCGVDGAFITRQYLLTRCWDERPLLLAAAEELSRAGTLVTFNGKSFDAPVLEMRYLFHRLAWMGERLPHVDMLHIARRFWGPADCSLPALERQVLGVFRHDDIAGFEIPSRYFHFVRSGDVGPLGAVLEHNRRDLVSLAALTAQALYLVRDGPVRAHRPREALALGRTYSRAGLAARARAAYEQAVGLCGADGWRLAETASVYVEALRALARDSRRARRYHEAAGYWRRILDARAGPAAIRREASEALAIHHEHRVGDLAEARAFALDAVDRGSLSIRHQAARHRLTRIQRKLDELNARGSRLQFG